LLCCGFARNLAIYRSGQHLGRSLIENGNHAGFWSEINSNCLDIAVLEWCKLFSDKRGKHYWQRVISSKRHASFGRGLLNAVGLSAANYQGYVDEIRLYRDKFVAHLDDDRAMNLPQMGPAQKGVWYLYQYVVNHECAVGDLFGLPNTEEKFENAFQQCVWRADQIFIGLKHS
jgi:hypothetical protein